MDKPFVHNPNTGTLFANSNRTSERSPNYTGKINIGGKMYWISGWVKNGQNSQFLSLAVNPIEDQQNISPNPNQQNTFENDDVPF